MKNDLNDLLTWALQFNKTAKIKDNYVITEDAYLSCSNMQLTELPNNIDKLNVDDFYCSFNQITKLPDSIGNMKVNVFNCSNNYITKLPNSISNMKVKDFYCWYNNLTELPDSICNMTVNNFYCSHNQIAELPDSICNMKVDNFQCSFNQLTKLPDSIGNMKVNTFDCSNNQLTKLPNTIGNMKVDNFNCFYNRLTKFPDSIGNMKVHYFNCSGNRLKNLPDSIINMKVNEFYCVNNRLEKNHIKPNRLIEGIFEEESYCFFDGILSHIINIKTKDNVKIIKTLNSYIVTDGINHAHGKDIKTAYLDYRFKIATKDLEQYKSINIDELHNLDFLYGLYRNITGSCQFGMADWISNNNDFIEKTEKSGSCIRELLEITENDFGNDKLIEFFNL